MSAMPLGEVVRVPRSGTERRPKSLVMIESLGTCLSGPEPVSEKGPVDLRSSEIGSQSKMLRMVSRVPPLAPEDLLRIRIFLNQFIVDIEDILKVLDAAVDSTGLRSKVLADALDKSPCQNIRWNTFHASRWDDLIFIRQNKAKKKKQRTYNAAIGLGRFMVLVDDELDPGCLSGPARIPSQSK
jgi:hypothetical protein